MSEEKEIIEVPEKFQDLVKKIENLSALDLSELVKVLENKFGVSAAAPVAMMAGGNAGGDEGGAAAAPDRLEACVTLTALQSSRRRMVMSWLRWRG